MFETIVWSTKTYSLMEFINSDRFLLPQLVQVESGIYSENDAKTLSQGQILFLHFTKRTDKVRAKVTGEKEFFIPINFPCKVSILPTVCEDVYYSVQDIADATWVKFFRVVHDSPPTFRLKAGDIMEIKRTFEEKREQYIECEFVNKTRDSVKLPLLFKAAFEPLESAELHDFTEVLHRFRFPIRVKFTSGEAILNPEVNDDIEWPPVGSVLLKEKIEESTVICTSRADNKVTILLIPTDLDVTVYPALGALTNDKGYARFCKNIHDGADLQKATNLFILNASKLSTERDVELEVLDAYEEIKPPIPPRSPPGMPSLEEDDIGYAKVRYTKRAEEFTPKPPLKRYPVPAPRLKRPHAYKQVSSSCGSSLRTVSQSDDSEFEGVGNQDEFDDNDGSNDDDVFDYDHADQFRREASVNEAEATYSATVPHELPCSKNKHGKETTLHSPVSVEISTLDFPDDLLPLSVSEVGINLKKLNMGEYVEMFESNQIDGKMLVTLTDESSLISVGVSKRIDQRKLLRFIHGGWRPKF